MICRPDNGVIENAALKRRRNESLDLAAPLALFAGQVSVAFFKRGSPEADERLGGGPVVGVIEHRACGGGATYEIGGQALLLGAGLFVEGARQDVVAGAQVVQGAEWDGDCRHIS